MTAAVVALPTAAPKKVRQSPSRTRAADRDALLRFPDRFKTPQERNRDERMALAMEADLPSLFLIVRAVAMGLDDREHSLAAVRLAMMAEQTGGAEAAAWFETFVTRCRRSQEGR